MNHLQRVYALLLSMIVMVTGCHILFGVEPPPDGSAGATGAGGAPDSGEQDGGPSCDCPMSLNECESSECSNGVCYTVNVIEGTPTMAQIQGDCKKKVCNGAGGTKQINEDDDAQDDGNDCTLDTCDNGSNVHTPMAGNCYNNTGVCSPPDGVAPGFCVECNADGYCPAGKVCVLNGAHICVPTECTDGVENGAETDIDCGGPVCANCLVGQDCMSADDCQSGVCSGALCVSCDTDTDCAAGKFCGTTDVGTFGVCSPIQAIGSTCSLPSQCASGYCVDGFCCNSACGGACQACSESQKVVGTNGICDTVLFGYDPGNECAEGACDGEGACKKHDGVPCVAHGECLSDNCSGGVCCTGAC